MGKNKKSKNISELACSCCGTGVTLPIAVAEPKRYKAMVLGCIDPRLQVPTQTFLKKKGLDGECSHMSIAGAAIAAVAPRFEAWHQAVWDNIDVSLRLHRFPKLILIQHRQCGAATEAYGYLYEKNRKGAKKLYRTVAKTFRRELAERHPQLKLEAFLMDLKGRHKRLL